MHASVCLICLCLKTTLFSILIIFGVVLQNTPRCRFVNDNLTLAHSHLVSAIEHVYARLLWVLLWTCKSQRQLRFDEINWAHRRHVSERLFWGYRSGQSAKCGNWGIRHMLNSSCCYFKTIPRLTAAELRGVMWRGDTSIFLGPLDGSGVVQGDVYGKQLVDKLSAL